MAEDELKELREEYVRFVRQVEQKVKVLNRYLRQMVQEKKSNSQLKGLTISLIEEVRGSEYPKKIIKYLEKRETKADFVYDKSDYEKRDWTKKNLQHNIHQLTSIVGEAKMPKPPSPTQITNTDIPPLLKAYPIWREEVTVGITPCSEIENVLKHVDSLFRRRSKKGP